jgi:hypothetical protein
MTVGTSAQAKANAEPHILPACEAMASLIRAERDLCANALCSSSEIALMLRVVVEAVCIPPCYWAMPKSGRVPAIQPISASKFNICDICLSEPASAGLSEQRRRKAPSLNAVNPARGGIRWGLSDLRSSSRRLK